MILRDIAEVAAAITLSGSSSQDLRRFPVDEYWKLNHFLHQHWKRAAFTNSRTIFPHATIYEEVIASELLVTAIAASLTTAAGPSRRDTNAEIASKLVRRHRDLKAYLLERLDDPLVQTTAALKIERFNRKMGRWTDLMLSWLPQNSDLTEFAAAPDRYLEFLDEQGEEGHSPIDLQLHHASLMKSVPKTTIGSPERAEAFRRIFAHAAVLMGISGGLLSLPRYRRFRKLVLNSPPTDRAPQKSHKPT